MNTTASTDNAVARLRLVEKHDDHIIVSIPGTQYRLKLNTAAPIDVETGKRVSGHIIAQVWKVDFVSTGGAYIEPVYGKPRRIQGNVTGKTAGTNALIVTVGDCPFIAQLPDRWQADDIPLGTRVGLDTPDTPIFELA